MSNSQVLLAGPTSPLPSEPARQPRVGRRLVLTVLAVVVFVAALLVVGLDGLIPFGLLLAFSADSDEEESRRSVIVTPRNLGLAAVMSAAFAGFWLWHLDLTESTLVLIGGALIALPLALQDSAGDRAARERTVAVTKRSLILAIWGLVVFVYLYYAYGQSFNMLAAVCVVLPLVLAASRAWGARRGRIEFGLLRHPLRRELRPHLVQALNIWLCCALLGGVLAAGGTHFARIAFSLERRPVRRHDRDLRRRPGPAGGVGARPSPARLRGHQRGRGPAVGLPRPPARPGLCLAHRCGRARLATGRRVVRPQRRPQRPAQRSLPEREQRRRLRASGGERANAHRRQRRPADRLRRLRVAGAGAGRRTDRRGDRRLRRQPARHQQRPRQPSGDRHRWRPLRVDGPPQAGQRHGPVGDVVRRGQPIAAVGNNGHSNEPHLHLQVQDSPAGADADRTYPMVFRNVDITRGGAWPWGDSREPRTGDLVRTLGQ